MSPFRLAGLVALALLVAGCDKCGEFKINTWGAPKACTEAKPRG